MSRLVHSGRAGGCEDCAQYIERGRNGSRSDNRDAAEALPRHPKIAQNLDMEIVRVLKNSIVTAPLCVRHRFRDCAVSLVRSESVARFPVLHRSVVKTNVAEPGGPWPAVQVHHAVSAS
jgi:hypothetical protein